MTFYFAGIISGFILLSGWQSASRYARAFFDRGFRMKPPDDDDKKLKDDDNKPTLER
jgi:hypothetical protein